MLSLSSSLRFLARAVVSFLFCGSVLAVVGCSGDPGPGPTPIAEPPRVSCPTPVSIVSASALPTSVVYGNATTTGGESPVTVTCTPASGSLFQLGANQVTCTARDNRSRADVCTFTVTVQRPAQISMTRFVAFGDSITAGEDGNALTSSWDGPNWTPGMLLSPSQLLIGREYPTVLQQLLAARYSSQTIVVHNEGFGGERASSSVAQTRFRDVLSARLPQVVLIMEGTNDIYGINGGNPSGIPGAISGLRSMIQTAKGRGVSPYLATVPPMNSAGSRGAQGYLTVPLLNEQIRQLASAERVPLVDVHAAFSGNVALLSSDGLHPNAAGFDVIAQAFFAVIRGTLESAAPASEPFGVANPGAW
ncbi:MAG: GDSL-type esterase/lipase family protein [Vicinamibacterales bacterium]